MKEAKKMIVKALMVVLVIGFSAVPCRALLGTGTAVGRVVREAIEYTARKFGISLAEESGQQFARQAERFILRYGDDGIRALEKGGPHVLRAARRYGDDAIRICATHGDEGARYLARHMDQALPVWKQFGRQGTGLMVRHPGLARPLLQKFGHQGLQIGGKLSTDSVGKFLQLAGKASSKIDLERLVDGALKYGDKFIEFLWSHKWKLAAGATVYTLLKDYEKGFTVVPAGRAVERRTVQPRSGVQYFLYKIIEQTLQRYSWLPLAGIGLAVLWLSPILNFMWAIPRFVRKLADKTKDLWQTGIRDNSDGDNQR